VRWGGLVFVVGSLVVKTLRVPVVRVVSPVLAA
jgi:hypothetical protein